MAKNILDKIKNELKKDIYLTTLIFLGVFIHILYFIILTKIARFHYVHFYDYYTRYAVITESIKSLDFTTVYRLFVGAMTPKIILYRSVPFMLLFGSSQLTYRFSALTFNYGLILILYHYLKKLFSRKDSFLITLFILSGSFSIELFASAYSDFSLLITTGIYYITIILFIKNPRKQLFSLTAVSTLMYLVKITSSLIVPITSLAFAIAILISTKIMKSRKIDSIKYLITANVLAILLYFLLGYFGNLKAIIYHTFTVNIPPQVLQESLKSNLIDPWIKTIYYILNINISYTKDIYLKFKEIYLIVLLYISIAYFLIKKREKKWLFIIFISELILIIISNYVVEVENVILAFFVPYHIIMYLFLKEAIFSKIRLKKITKYSVYILLLAIYISNLSYFLSQGHINPYYSKNSRESDFINYEIFTNYPVESTFFYDFGINDIIEYETRTFYDFGQGNYTKYSHIDKRFGYKLTNKIEKSNYILCYSHLCNKYENHTLLDEFILDKTTKYKVYKTILN